MERPVDPIARMVAQLSRLPGIGRKSAQRLAYFIAAQPEEYARDLAQAILTGREDIHLCSRCGNYTNEDPCEICSDTRRQHDTICVVRDPRDVASIERMREYHGEYHVLHGTISPMEGVGPEDIRIRELVSRLSDGEIKEVILATNPDIEGEATAAFIARTIKPLGVRVTRLAHGMPVGGDLEYVDEVTLTRAFEGRRDM